MLERHIINTICYYDVMDYPLTVFEIWKHLLVLEEDSKKYSLTQISDILKEDKLRQEVEESQGFFFLKGRENLVESRIEREKISSQKLKKVIKISKYLRLIPFIQFIGATGRVAMKNAKLESDLDVLIVFSPGNIFLGRFFTVFLLQILGKRRNKRKVKDRVCLNHFLTSDSSPQTQDIFSSHEYDFLLPIFSSKNSSFSLKKSFGWISKYKPNSYFSSLDRKKIKDIFLTRKTRKILEILFKFRFWEDFFKKIQIKKINLNPESKNKNGLIIITDQELAFWPEFQRQGPNIWGKFAALHEKHDLD